MAESPVGLFYREDLSRPENRVNVALFGALGIEPFHRAFAAHLGLPDDAVVFPPANTIGAGGSIRPDFCVQHSGTTIAWIEVELGADHAQLTRYSQELAEPVLTIWGQEAPGTTMTLDDVRRIAGDAQSGVLPQQSMQLQHLVGVIEEALRLGGPQHRMDVSEGMRESPFFARLDAAVGGIQPLSSAGSRRGSVYADTVSENGFSVRVASPTSRTNGATVSIFNRSAGRPYLQFNAREHLRRYLPGRDTEIDALAGFLSLLGADLDGASQRERRVPLELAEDNVEEIATLLQALADGGIAPPRS